MSTLRAPYHNGMRLGQGFNSYTQQICLDRAVLEDPRSHRASEKGSLKTTKDAEAPQQRQSSPDDKIGGKDLENWETVTAKPDAEQVQKVDASSSDTDLESGSKATGQHPAGRNVPPWVKPQIVTYSSRFVDKISDVTDSMNISGSVSIKTAQIGGKLGGSYVDSDKFKSSDMNFHLQVKVLNQVHDAKEYSEFNKIPTVDNSAFAEVYGDTFISGWEEGGELNAIISVKVLDKSKIFEIKGKIEAELTTPSFAGAIEAKLEMDKSTLSKDTETTISVNWSGGGSIKNPDADWTITSLKKAAAAFPDLVAMTPQRTFAILTKYTALESFHRKKDPNLSPLSYENAGIYTNALLDHYMDYKALWKHISTATFELEADRATIEIAQPSQDIADLAVIKALPPLETKNQKVLEAVSSGTGTESENSNSEQAGQLNLTSKAVTNATANEKGSTTTFNVFSPSFAGLIQARKVCRFEMSKIVNEVDLVAKHPTLASDTRRDEFFLHPLVFKQLLPIVRTTAVESAVSGSRDSNAAVLLGYDRPKTETLNLPQLHIFEQEFSKHELALRSSASRLRHKSPNFRMQGCAGIIKGLDAQATLVNDLEIVDATYRPTKISTWYEEKRLKGVQIIYSNGQKRSHGLCNGVSTYSLELDHEGSELITEVCIKEARDINEVLSIASIAIATSTCRVLDTPEVSAEKTHTWSMSNERRWSLRGFFSFHQENGLQSLGVVWGKAGFVPVPAAKPRTAICTNFLEVEKGLQESITAISTLQPTLAEKFAIGGSIKTGGATERKVFNALETIQPDWTIKTIAFSTVSGQLSGLKVTYGNGQIIEHGTYSAETEVWKCDVKSPVTVVKITSAKSAKESPVSFVNTVELVRAQPDGKMPLWPLDIATVRYLGAGLSDSLVETAAFIEQAPVLNRAPWSLRGFYGETSQGVICQLGVIWGRS